MPLFSGVEPQRAILKDSDDTPHKTLPRVTYEQRLVRAHILLMESHIPREDVICMTGAMRPEKCQTQVPQHLGTSPKNFQHQPRTNLLQTRLREAQENRDQESHATLSPQHGGDQYTPRTTHIENQTLSSKAGPGTFILGGQSTTQQFHTSHVSSPIVPAWTAYRCTASQSTQHQPAKHHPAVHRPAPRVPYPVHESKCVSPSSQYPIPAHGNFMPLMTSNSGDWTGLVLPGSQPSNNPFIVQAPGSSLHADTGSQYALNAACQFRAPLQSNYGNWSPQPSHLAQPNYQESQALQAGLEESASSQYVSETGRCFQSQPAMTHGSRHLQVLSFQEPLCQPRPLLPIRHLDQDNSQTPLSCSVEQHFPKQFFEVEPQLDDSRRYARGMQKSASRKDVSRSRQTSQQQPFSQAQASVVLPGSAATGDALPAPSKPPHLQAQPHHTRALNWTSTTSYESSLQEQTTHLQVASSRTLVGHEHRLCGKRHIAPALEAGETPKEARVEKKPRVQEPCNSMNARPHASREALLEELDDPTLTGSEIFEIWDHPVMQPTIEERRERQARIDAMSDSQWAEVQRRCQEVFGAEWIGGTGSNQMNRRQQTMAKEQGEVKHSTAEWQKACEDFDRVVAEQREVEEQQMAQSKRRNAELSLAARQQETTHRHPMAKQLGIAEQVRIAGEQRMIERERERVEGQGLRFQMVRERGPRDQPAA